MLSLCLAPQQQYVWEGSFSTCLVPQVLWCISGSHGTVTSETTNQGEQATTPRHCTNSGGHDSPSLHRRPVSWPWLPTSLNPGWVLTEIFFLRTLTGLGTPSTTGSYQK